MKGLMLFGGFLFAMAWVSFFVPKEDKRIEAAQLGVLVVGAAIVIGTMFWSQP
ncbi:MAG TPA: hypothetical protein VIT62_14585 [Lysobacter sp.]